jgi:hypothetical protein
MESACLKSMRKIAAESAQASLRALHDEALAVAGGVCENQAQDLAQPECFSADHDSAGAAVCRQSCELAAQEGAAAADQPHADSADAGTPPRTRRRAAAQVSGLHMEPTQLAADAECLLQPASPVRKRRRHPWHAAALEAHDKIDAGNGRSAAAATHSGAAPGGAGAAEAASQPEDEHAALLAQLELAQDILGAGASAQTLEALGVAPVMFSDGLSAPKACAGTLPHASAQAGRQDRATARAHRTRASSRDAQPGRGVQQAATRSNSSSDLASADLADTSRSGGGTSQEDAGVGSVRFGERVRDDICDARGQDDVQTVLAPAGEHADDRADEVQIDVGTPDVC